MIVNVAVMLAEAFAMLFTDIMPILRADAKELAGNRHADIEQLLYMLPGALTGAKAASTMKRYTPLWE